MLEWMKRTLAVAFPSRASGVEPAQAPTPPGRVVSGSYRALYEYLEKRYATTVVLTFAEIEDLLGSTLPERARVDLAWWADAAPDAAGVSRSDCWTLARRTATPNLPARNVAFERAS